MSKFIENAIRKQEEAYKVSFAKRQFEYSCTQCCTRGLRIGDCSRCPIAQAHQEAVQAIIAGQRKAPKKTCIRSVDRKGHVTLVIRAEDKNLDINVEVVVK